MTKPPTWKVWWCCTRWGVTVWRTWNNCAKMQAWPRCWGTRSPVRKRRANFSISFMRRRRSNKRNGRYPRDEERLISWLRNPQRADGPQGFIGFAVSARMSEALQRAILAKAEESWQLDSEDSVSIKECAEVVYVPEETPENRYQEPLRYVAIRIRKKQQGLFADGSTVKHFAVMSNRWDLSPKKLLQWQREKAGTIEGVHDVIKNELAGGVMPCGRFGSNAAWLRLSVLTYNLLTALKRLVLPPELIKARPKQLRFL